MSITPRSPITPSVPPLSQSRAVKHAGFETSLQQPAVKIVAASVVVLIFLITCILWLGDLFQPDVQSKPTPNQTTAALNKNTQPITPVEAPFNTLSLSQAKEAAQSELGRFVKLQIQLEDQYNVKAWSEQSIQAAKDQALVGDNHFIQDEFTSAIDAYKAAANQLAKLLSHAQEKYAKHLETAAEHVLSLDDQAAVIELTAAKVFKPLNPELLALSKRATQLPKIKDLLLQARNFELTEKYAQALVVYAKVKQLDAQILGLAKNIAAAKKAKERQTVKKLLGEGFKYLEQENFAQARKAFSTILQTDATNTIALAGLEQVSQRHDVAIILDNERSAKEHLANEQWPEAIAAYTAILTLDDNIQLAKNGKLLAQSHARTEKVLTRISAQPSKLSSANLFAQASNIVKDANALKYKGPRLNTLIDSVSKTLALYRDPVLVTLLSDNSTDVVLSNIGKLGTFQSKVLSLRPGEYTIRGSANGCRDIYLTVTVLPGIAPIEVLCRETVR